MSAIVLAGGSGGLGAASAHLLAGEGFPLVVSYRSNVQRAGKLAGIAKLVQADLTIAEDRERLLDAAPDIYGLVVFTGDPARIAEPAQTEAAMLRSHAVNYLGPILLAREAAARMKAKSTPGAIVLISTDLDEIFALSDRAAILSQGELAPLDLEAGNAAEIGLLLGGVSARQQGT